MVAIPWLVIILIHWFADFVCQTDAQAKNKSHSMFALLAHTSSYAAIWYPFCILYYYMTGGANMLLFPVITFVVHTIQDYFTSRLNKRLWEKGDVHNFFVSIGFDQVLHYVQLFLTFIWLA